MRRAAQLSRPPELAMGRRCPRGAAKVPGSARSRGDPPPKVTECRVCGRVRATRADHILVTQVWKRRPAADALTSSGTLSNTDKRTDPVWTATHCYRWVQGAK